MLAPVCLKHNPTFPQSLCPLLEVLEGSHILRSTLTLFGSASPWFRPRPLRLLRGCPRATERPDHSARGSRLLGKEARTFLLKLHFRSRCMVFVSFMLQIKRTGSMQRCLHAHCTLDSKSDFFFHHFVVAGELTEISGRGHESSLPLFPVNS